MTLPPTMDTARQIARMAPLEFVRCARSFNRVNLEIGRKATLAECQELFGLRQMADARFKELLSLACRTQTEADVNAALAQGQMPQFYSEAIAEFDLCFSRRGKS